jgi:hypothetical protein
VSSSNYFCSSVIISSVTSITGILAFCNLSWDSDNWMNVASSGSVDGMRAVVVMDEEEGAGSGEGMVAVVDDAISHLFSLAARQTMSLALIMSVKSVPDTD